MPEETILDMQYDLAAHRNIALDSNMPSMALLYFYSKYKKEREAAQQQERIRKQAGKQRKR